MIAKELESLTVTDNRRTAGHAAESQLAFYLQRTFVDAPEIHVFNSLRFESDGDAAQVDHLVVHPSGLIVIESKSVHAKVKINERGEWLRLYKGHYQGMPSAKLQAERQILFLRRFLESHASQLLDTSRRPRSSFVDMPIDLLVAISDGAVIDRPKGEAYDYLVKAEAVPERIAGLVKSRRSGGGFFGLFRSGFSLSFTEVAGLTSFFLESHRPLVRTSSIPEAITEVVALESEQLSKLGATEQRCKHCCSSKLEIRSGRYGYFFGCLSCDKSTAISRSCGSCGAKERVRKQGRTFSSDCATCDRSEVFFVNA